MKRIGLSISNSLMAISIARSLEQTGEFQITSLRPGREALAEECADTPQDIVLMEAALNNGATLDDCLQAAKKLRRLCPGSRILLLCDENSAPEVARRIALAKKDGLIDDFVYSSVSESYLTAMLHAL